MEEKIIHKTFIYVFNLFQTPSPSVETQCREESLENSTGEENASCSSGTISPKYVITPEEYFSADVDLDGRDIGRPKKVTAKV